MQWLLWAEISGSQNTQLLQPTHIVNCCRGSSKHSWAMSQFYTKLYTKLVWCMLICWWSMDGLDKYWAYVSTAARGAISVVSMNVFRLFYLFPVEILCSWCKRETKENSHIISQQGASIWYSKPFQWIIPLFFLMGVFKLIVRSKLILNHHLNSQM